jgi:hypothetical protein
MVLKKDVQLDRLFGLSQGIVNKFLENGCRSSWTEKLHTHAVGRKSTTQLEPIAQGNVSQFLKATYFEQLHIY